MLTRLAIVACVFAASAVQPAFAVQSCPKGVEIKAGGIRTVAEIIRIKRLHPGQQINFERLHLPHADFSGQDISDLCFSNANLVHSKWTRARGTNSRFVDAALNASDWRGFEGRGLEFHASTLDRANLSHATFRRTRFGWTTMEHVDASHADLSGGSFEGGSMASIKGASFRSANMTGFEFRCGLGQGDNCGQDSSDVSLVGANLTGTALLMASKSDWNLTGATIANTRLHMMQLNWLRRSRIAGPVLVEPTSWTPARYDWTGAAPASGRVALSRREIEQVWAAFDRAETPGFACARARSAAEQYICRERSGEEADAPSAFAYADRELNDAYVIAWRKDPSVVATQRQWLRERDACMAVAEKWKRIECFDTAYQERTEALWRMAEKPDLASGTRIYADEQTAGFLSAVEDPALRRKLARGAFWNSWQLVIVESLGRGRLYARGEAMGPNYHLGSLNSPEDGMVYDPISGFYGAREMCLAGYRVCPLVRFRGRYLEVGPEIGVDPATGDFGINEYVMTGARAQFERLVRVPLDRGDVVRLAIRPDPEPRRGMY
jgi:uncharacterized protein YjbI with pentapeptide repeats/uncharacterized protein